MLLLKLHLVTEGEHVWRRKDFGSWVETVISHVPENPCFRTAGSLTLSSHCLIGLGPPARSCFLSPSLGQGDWGSNSPNRFLRRTHKILLVLRWDIKIRQERIWGATNEGGCKYQGENSKCFCCSFKVWFFLCSPGRPWRSSHLYLLGAGIWVWVHLKDLVDEMPWAQDWRNSVLDSFPLPIHLRDIAPG